MLTDVKRNCEDARASGKAANEALVRGLCSLLVLLVRLGYTVPHDLGLWV